MNRVAVIGGGLAGLAAAVAASERGFDVELFEARRRLGGRAGSFTDPQTGQRVDLCQHVAMGCCTQWADFCRRTAIDDGFELHRRLWFVGPDARQYAFGASPLPAPLHLFPSLLRLGYVSLAERLSIARAMMHMMREESHPEETIGDWLRRHGQSERAIAWFWSVVLVSALSESVDRASFDAARKVFRDGLMAHRRAYELYIPRTTLGEIYDRRIGAWLKARGVAVHLGERVRGLDIDGTRAAAIVRADGSRSAFACFIVAVPWRGVRRLFPATALERMPELEGVDAIPAAPIAAIHLWFDRPIMAQPHAVLVGRLAQWIFAQPQQAMEGVLGHDHYYQVVISAAYDLRHSSRDAILARVRSEIEAIWPAAREARLLRWRVVIEPAAVFSVQPGLDRRRPAQATSLANVALAGDWTRTGWPATMEGAVRSGYLAVEAILEKRDRSNFGRRGDPQVTAKGVEIRPVPFSTPQP